MDYKLYNDNCLNVLSTLEDSSIDCILTDPPFGNGLSYGRRELGPRTIKNDDNLDWLPAWSKEAFRLLKDDSHCVVFWQWRTYSILEKEMRNAGFTIKTVGVWDKGRPGLGAGIVEQYEQVIVFLKGDAKQRKFRGNVFRYPRVFGRPEHPHEKPVDLLGDLLLLCSDEGDLILDPFAGSFNSGVAATRYKRNYIGIELEEKYYKIGDRRLKAENSQSSLF